jgi:5-bromo-4-chloroindolyl phosphate hydrolysis protein
MSRGRGGRPGRSGVRSLLFIILGFIILGKTGALGALLGGLLAGVLPILIFVFGISALAIGLITSLVKGSSSSDSQARNNKANKNPYSVNYDEGKGSTATNSQTVVDGTSAKRSSDVFVDSVVVEPKKEEKPVEETAKETAKEEPMKHRVTGNPDIDKMIVDKDLAIQEMKRLDEAIEDEVLSERIVHLQEVTERIVNYIIDHPKKKKQVAKFFNYYLPTTIKLLNAYERMDDVGISGMNIDNTKGAVEEMMGTALAAFDKQLDALYADEALDVTTDIKVMENMLKAEGLTDDLVLKL